MIFPQRGGPQGPPPSGGTHNIKESAGMKKHGSTFLLILVLIAGLSLVLYPTVSDLWNSMHQSRAIANYTRHVEQLAPTDYTDVKKAAYAYNESLYDVSNRFFMTDEHRAYYETLLDVSDIGIMAYIEIPKMDCKLPVYHGTSEAVLQVAIGHVEGSSLPVGGLGSHCVLSGHRGLPSAKLFTNLDRMEVGDTFMLYVLDEILTYQVDQILVVLPDDVSALALDPEADLCTLVTCTPYGVNSHRLLVRGHRVETILEEEVEVVVIRSDAELINPLIVAACIASPVLLILFIILLATPPKRHDEW